MSVDDATVEMHPHDTAEKRFVCYCGKAHEWGERGMLTFRLPQPEHDERGYQMIRCPCGTWHMKFIQAQDAVNAILAESEAKPKPIDTRLEVHSPTVDSKTFYGGN